MQQQTAGTAIFRESQNHAVVYRYSSSNVVGSRTSIHSKSRDGGLQVYREVT